MRTAVFVRILPYASEINSTMGPTTFSRWAPASFTLSSAVIRRHITAELNVNDAGAQRENVVGPIVELISLAYGRIRTNTAVRIHRHECAIANAATGQHFVRTTF